MTENILFYCIAAPEHKEKHFFLPLISSDSGDDDLQFPGFQRTQSPIRAYPVLTANNASSQYLPGTSGHDLRKDCFTQGTMYVTLSRTTHPEKIVCTDRRIGLTTNIVCPSALSSLSNYFFVSCRLLNSFLQVFFREELISLQTFCAPQLPISKNKVQSNFGHYFQFTERVKLL